MKRKISYPEAGELNKSNRLEIRELTLQHGLNYPSDAELIMLILGSGSRERPIDELAGEVLDIVMSTNQDNLIDALIKIKGIGRSKALVIASALEFGKRINRNPQAAMKSPADIIPYIQNYAVQKQEHFLCVSLNGAREIISIRVICKGAGNMAVIHPADVFSEAIKEHASAVIISHNHPSGNPRPSEEDISTTARLYQAAEILGIHLLDHIIICREGYYSFLEHDFMDESKLFALL
ncbi:MAG: DNA repair protein RadC [Treponema sp.]|nr:DNA repair protein RadC [Treponema sp.]